MGRRKRAPKGGRNLWIVAAATLVVVGTAGFLSDHGEPATATDKTGTAVVASSRIDQTDAPRPAAQSASASEPEAAANAASGGYIAYIDPDTGRLIPKPPPEDADVIALTASTAAGFSRSHEGLYEEVLPNGAIKLNLQGRFKSASFATLGDDGKVRVSHEVPRSRTQREPAPTESATQSGGEEKNDGR